MKTILIMLTLLISFNSMAESRLLYNHWEREAYLLCVNQKLWVYTFIGLGMETTSTRNPFSKLIFSVDARFLCMKFIFVNPVSSTFQE